MAHVTGSATCHVVGPRFLEIAGVPLSEERGQIIRVRAMWDPAHLSAAGRPEEGISAILLGTGVQNMSKIPESFE